MRKQSYLRSSLFLLFVTVKCGAFSTLPLNTQTRVVSPLPSHYSPAPISMSNLRYSDKHEKAINEPQETRIKSQVEKNHGVLARSTDTFFAAAALAALLVPQSALAFELSSNSASMMESIAQTGFYQAFSLVFLSEIGDKTFFIAGLLAMKTSKFISYLGSMGALAAMTFLSVLIGQLFHAVPTGLSQGLPLDDIAATLAFAFFGYKTLTEALGMDDDAPGIMDEELADAEEAVEGQNSLDQSTKIGQLLSIFTLVFAAEFGDRSFLSTIALSAAQNPLSVAGGAIAAHGVATGIAVGGGAYLAKYVSEKVIGIISGALFLVFAVTTAFGIF